MVNSDLENERHRFLREDLRNRIQELEKVMRELCDEVKRSRELRDEVRWTKFFEYNQNAIEFFEKLERSLDTDE